jgi:hypothetical protein
MIAAACINASGKELLCQETYVMAYVEDLLLLILPKIQATG